MFGKTLRCEEVKHQYGSQETAEFDWQGPAALVNALDTEGQIDWWRSVSGSISHRGCSTICSSVVSWF